MNALNQPVTTAFAVMVVVGTVVIGALMYVYSRWRLRRAEQRHRAAVAKRFDAAIMRMMPEYFEGTRR